MSANPIDKNTTPNTTGSLEDLFRHHLGEEAAVPPRPLLWDQIDNSLLIRQNETYRRRLAATRWVAAASLLLATLAGTGWWATRYAGIGGTQMATVGRPASAPDRMMAATSRPATPSSITAERAAAAGEVANRAIAGTTPAHGHPTILDGAATPTGPATSFGPGAARANLAQGVATGGGKGGRNRFESTGRGNSATAGPLGSGSRAAFAARSAQAAGTAGTAGTDLAASTAPVAASVAASAPDAARALAGGSVAASTTAVMAATTTSGLVAGTTAAATPIVAAVAPAATAGTAAGQVGLLAAHPAALSLSTPAALPNGLTALALPAETEPAALPIAHKWRYSASYTASAFNPNINFSRAGIEHEYGYNPALGADSPALTEAAATEYRQNLRPGLSQRLALLATRHLVGHWSLSTGAEFTQATARSASTAGFVGEQLYDLGPYSTGPRQNTNFQYRLASIPVELRYANPAKRGLSLYGRLGGVVSALLGVRSEVEGNPEATRTYSILSAGGPYRRMLGSVRGGAGAQFRPATGSWAFTLGPVAELGLVSLNAHPAQPYPAQSRPYSFGLEAGVEFGR